MKRWQKLLVSSLLTLSICAIGLVVLVETVLSGMCGNSVVQESASPDKMLKAVVFERNCGATTGFSTQISLLSANATLRNEAGNIFIVDGRPQEVGIVLRWLGNRKLEIGASLPNRRDRADVDLHSLGVDVSYARNGN